MITEIQPCVIVLQLIDELLVQLQPFIAGLDITATAHMVEHSTQRLTMRGEVYAALAERVGSPLDYEVRWQPNEYEPDDFVEPCVLKNSRTHPRGVRLLAVWSAAPRQPRRGRVRVRPSGRLNLASMPGRPDTDVSGRPFLCVSRPFWFGCTDC